MVLREARSHQLGVLDLPLLLSAPSTFSPFCAHIKFCQTWAVARGPLAHPRLSGQYCPGLVRVHICTDTHTYMCHPHIQLQPSFFLPSFLPSRLAWPLV